MGDLGIFQQKCQSDGIIMRYFYTLKHSSRRYMPSKSWKNLDSLFELIQRHLHKSRFLSVLIFEVLYHLDPWFLRFLITETKSQWMKSNQSAYRPTRQCCCFYLRSNHIAVVKFVVKKTTWIAIYKAVDFKLKPKHWQSRLQIDSVAA